MRVLDAQYSTETSLADVYVRVDARLADGSVRSELVGSVPSSETAYADAERIGKDAVNRLLKEGWKD